MSKTSPTIFNQGGHTGSVYEAFIFQNISTDIFDTRQLLTRIKNKRVCVAAASAAKGQRKRKPRCTFHIMPQLAFCVQVQTSGLGQTDCSFQKKKNNPTFVPEYD